MKCSEVKISEVEAAQEQAAQAAQIAHQQAQARREFSNSLKNLPIFNANRQKGETWRTHRASFNNWMILHAIQDLVGVDHIKRALLLSLHGQAARATDLHGPDTPTYAQAGTIEAYLDVIQQVFQPASESAMARMDFEGRTQSRTEPISEYLSDKTALYHMTEPDAARRNFTYLRNHLLKGVHSNFVKGEVIRADPQDTATLYTNVVCVPWVKPENLTT